MAAVFHRRTDISGPADTQYPLIIHINAIIMAQIVIQPSVTLIWAFHMNLFNSVSQTLVLQDPAALFSTVPFMISGTCYVQQGTGCLNWVPLFLMAFFDCPVNLMLLYF